MSQRTQVVLLENFSGLRFAKAQEPLPFSFREVVRNSGADYHPHTIELDERHYRSLATSESVGQNALSQEVRRRLVIFLAPLTNAHVQLAAGCAKTRKGSYSSNCLSSRIESMARVRSMLQEAHRENLHRDKYALVEESLLGLCVEALLPQAIVRTLAGLDRPFTFADFQEVEVCTETIG
jgi:hypothetical protein